jgi:hypothetical protein
MAYVVAIHDIRDPEKFWGAADQAAEFPAGITLHGSYPNEDGSHAVCLWEADSADAVRELVDGAVGDSSQNQFFEVNSQHSGTRGLPTAARA